MERRKMPKNLVRIIIFSNILAYLSYRTTGYPPQYLDVLVLLSSISAMILAPSEKISGGFIAFCSLSFLFLGFLQIREGLPMIVALGNFASGIMVLQEIQIHDARSAKLSLTLSGMLVLVGGAMNVNFLFPLLVFPFTGCLILSLFGIALFEQKAASRIEIRNFGGITPKMIFFWVTLLVPIWISLFYLFPRGEVRGRTALVGKQQLVGFSDTMKFGDVASVIDNTQIVMRVKPLVRSPVSRMLMKQLEQIYMRGCSFVSFHNKTWSREGYRSLPFNLQKTRGELTLRNSAEDSRHSIFLEIFLENTDPPIMFVPDQTQSVYSDIPSLNVDIDNSISFGYRRSGIETYRVLTKLGKPTITDSPPLDQVSFPKFLKPFRDPGDVSNTVVELAEQVASSCKTTMEAVNSVKRYLQQNCEYAMEDSPP